MGCDCTVHFPATVKSDDVLAVIGALVGCKVEKVDLGGGSYSARVQGTKWTPTHHPGYVLFSYDATMVAEHGFNPSFFIESGDPQPYPGGKELMMSSTPGRIALAKRLVEFFGGKADFNDCDEGKFDLSRPVVKRDFRQMQDALLALNPLTPSEIDKCRKVAGYPEVKF
jgi:hypothetical protein